jgi:hypothetical protein
VSLNILLGHGTATELQLMETLNADSLIDLNVHQIGANHSLDVYRNRLSLLTCKVNPRDRRHIPKF